MKVFGDEENLTNINLKNIDPKRFTLRCQVCKTKDGACLQCQHGRCQAAFHPECGKDYFTNTRDKTGYDEVNIYCPLHKPLKLRRVLEGKEKKCVEDILSFCKSFQKFERRAKNTQVAIPAKQTTQTEKPFSYKEKDKFIKVIDKEIQKISNLHKSEFFWTFKLKSTSLRNNLEVTIPNHYNLLDPQAILVNKITIPGRKYTECYKFYSDSIFDLLKDELTVMNRKVSVFYPKIKKKRVSKEKTKEKVYIQTIIEAPILADIVSDEVYCICRKPFIEKSFKKPWESEADFSIRQADSQMIQCEKCLEWFHYKCIGLKIDSIVPESYFCNNCDDSTKILIINS